MTGDTITLSHDAARRFYDRFGAKQDRQAFYEDRATRELRAHANWPHAHAVFEFGCGTGRFAAELLTEALPPTATYAGCDLSATMVELARQRLARFDGRARVQLSDGAPRIDAMDAAFDRVVSTYVLDLLSPADIGAAIAEAHRVLRSDGVLCLVGLTPGTTLLSRAVTSVWMGIHRLRPRLVGGCRPLELCDSLDRARWDLAHRSIVVAFGIASEVIVARKR